MVSVIIVNYYCAALTAKATESVYADETTAEVIVIDNSVNKEEYNKLITLLPKETLLIVLEENVGFGKACNIGYGHCQYDFVFFLNPDTLVIKGCLRKLKDALVSNRNLGAVSPQSFWDENFQFFLPPGQLQTPLWELIQTFGYKWQWFGDLLSTWFRNYFLFTIKSKTTVKQKMLSGAHLMTTRAVIQKIGCLFDEDFFLYYEDTDLNFRIHTSGFKLAMVPEAHVVHFWRNDASKYTFFGESRRIYMEKHFPKSFILTIQKFVQKTSITPACRYTDMGVLTEPPTFIEKDLNGKWVLEISTNRLFVPSSIKICLDKKCQIPLSIWKLLGSSEYWARIGNEKESGKVFKWEIV